MFSALGARTSSLIAAIFKTYKNKQLPPFQARKFEDLTFASRLILTFPSFSSKIHLNIMKGNACRIVHLCSNNQEEQAYRKVNHFQSFLNKMFVKMAEKRYKRNKDLRHIVYMYFSRHFSYFFLISCPREIFEEQRTIILNLH